MKIRFDLLTCEDGRILILKIVDGKERSMHGPFKSMKRALSFCRQEEDKK